jgi:PPOX class probable F420-dependent enzyme
MVVATLHHTNRHEPCTTGSVAGMARKDITMSQAEVLDFLEDSRVLQVATIGRDGTPHLAPMWFFVEEGKVVFRSFTKSQKIVNLIRDPRLTVLAEAGEAYEELRGVMIKGTGRLIDDPKCVLAAYGRLAARYPMVGSEPVELAPDALEAAFGRMASKNTAVIVEPEQVASWDHRKLGGAY